MHQAVATFLLLAGYICAQAQAPAALSAAVMAYVRSQGDSDLPRFRHASVNLNGDREPDAIVLLLGPNWCGSGGCTLLVLKAHKGTFTLVSSTSVTLEPIRQASEQRHGWSSLVVHSRGRGEVLLRFDGKTYPSNPSLQPVASKSQLASARVLIK